MTDTLRADLAEIRDRIDGKGYEWKLNVGLVSRPIQGGFRAGLSSPRQVLVLLGSRITGGTPTPDGYKHFCGDHYPHG